MTPTPSQPDIERIYAVLYNLIENGIAITTSDLADAKYQSQSLLLQAQIDELERADADLGVVIDKYYLSERLDELRAAQQTLMERDVK